MVRLDEIRLTVVNPLSSAGETSQACVHGEVRPLVAGCSGHHLANMFGVQNTDNEGELSAAHCRGFISGLKLEGFL